MGRKIRSFGVFAAAVIIMAAAAGAAFAGELPAAGAAQQNLFDEIFRPLFKTVVFGLVGLVFLLISYRVIDIATPFDMNKEISQDDNTAAGVLAAGMMISLAIILHAAISKL